MGKGVSDLRRPGAYAGNFCPGSENGMSDSTEIQAVA